jgi:hypothetical protein
MPLICRPIRSLLQQSPTGNDDDGRHGAEHAQGEGVGLPYAQDEAERDLTKTIEDAMADGEIDEDEQNAILKKKVSLRNFSLPLSLSLSLPASLPRAQ